MKCTSTDNGQCDGWANLNRPVGSVFQDPIVQASILTIQHSFTVQSYNRGATMGGLHLFGSFAQKFRGPVGTSNNGNVSTGYVKDYEYDTRLRYAPPPFFLDPVRSSWGVKAYGEGSAAY